MTGQFGKNHLGDKDEFLPTNHGFDEFFGNLYHLNAEEEPENPDYPKNPEFKKKFGPRGVIKATAGGKIEDTGPLTKKRMETIDEEVLAVTQDFLGRAKKADKPFFCWFNTTRMHNFTHVKEENLGKTGLGFYADGMVEHDALVGKLLKTVDDLGLDGEHHRHLHHRQRPDGLPLSGCRMHALPRREEHQLGRRLARSGPDPLARRGQARHQASPTSSPARTGCPRCWPLPVSPTSRRNCSRATRPATRPSRSTSMATTSSTTFPARARKASATSSSTSATTATCSPCATSA